MEGAREGRGGKERENIEEGWEGVIVSHVEHAQHICFKWHRHKFVPLKKGKNELHPWFSAHYLAWDHSES